MGMLSLASGLVKLLGSVMGYINNKKLMDAGEAKATLKTLSTMEKRIDKAIKIQRRIRTDPEYRNSMRERATRDK